MDLIEYLAENIRDIKKRWNDERYKNFKYTYCYDTAKVFNEFKQKINEIFELSGLLYRLTDEKKIERITEYSTITPQIEAEIDAVDEPGVKGLLKAAIALFRKPRSKETAANGQVVINNRSLAVEKLWDTFERLKTYYGSGKEKPASADRLIGNMSNGETGFFELFQEEFFKLTRLGNNFRIRHHEIGKIEITDDRIWDYLFNRCLALIVTTLQFLPKNNPQSTC